MEDRRRARLLTQKKRSRPKSAAKEERKRLARSLQTPHKQWQRKELVTFSSSEIGRPSQFPDRTANLKRKPLFQLVFLGDADQSVQVEEVYEVDFVQLKTRLNEGKSVFITRRESEKVELPSLGELEEGIEIENPGS